MTDSNYHQTRHQANYQIWRLESILFWEHQRDRIYESNHPDRNQLLHTIEEHLALIRDN